MAKVANLGFGYKPDLPDQRDYHYIPQLRGLLPEQVDLKDGCPPVYNQGKLGSCTANAVAAALDFERRKQKEAFITPSRLFIYYNERLSEGTVDSDSGASIRDSVKEVVKYGACPENLWPYEIDLFTEKPNDFCYQDAVKYEALKYLRLPQTEQALKSTLAEGYPFVFGISVYESFMTPKNGFVPLPRMDESLLGGHAQMCVGYETIKDHEYWIVRNSWGTNWGLGGYYYLPLEYALSKSLASDFWSLRLTK